MLSSSLSHPSLRPFLPCHYGHPFLRLLRIDSPSSTSIPRVLELRTRLSMRFSSQSSPPRPSRRPRPGRFTLSCGSRRGTLAQLILSLGELELTQLHARFSRDTACAAEAAARRTIRGLLNEHAGFPNERTFRGRSRLHFVISSPHPAPLADPLSELSPRVSEALQGLEQRAQVCDRAQGASSTMLGLAQSMLRSPSQVRRRRRNAFLSSSSPLHLHRPLFLLAFPLHLSLSASALCTVQTRARLSSRTTTRLAERAPPSRHARPRPRLDLRPARQLGVQGPPLALRRSAQRLHRPCTVPEPASSVVAAAHRLAGADPRERRRHARRRVGRVRRAEAARQRHGRPREAARLVGRRAAVGAVPVARRLGGGRPGSSSVRPSRPLLRPAPPRTDSHVLLGQQELVVAQAPLRREPHLPPHLLGLRRVGHLHLFDPGHHGGVRRRPGRCDSRLESLRLRVRHRPECVLFPSSSLPSSSRSSS